MKNIRKIELENKRLQLLLCGCLCLLFMIIQQMSVAQQPEKKKSQIIILGNDYGEFLLNDTLNVQRLMRNVKLLHDGDTIYCDSAIVYEQKITAEAFGNVLIKQLDGTIAMADYMRYTGNDKSVVMRGDVQLMDKEKNELWSEEVTYNLTTKIGKYFKNGTLVSGETMVSSEEATYNMKTKDARFKRNVIINDPEYHVVSSDLGYNTQSRVATFFGPSVVTNENSLMQTTAGTYNSLDKTSHFWNRTSIFNDGQYIEGDTLKYDKNTGWAKAYGNVICIDTAERSYLYCGYAQYNELTKEMKAYLQPVMKKISEEDTLYLRGDTLIGGVVKKIIDSISDQDKLNKTVDDLWSSASNDSLGDAIDEQDDMADLIKTDPDYSKIKSQNHIPKVNEQIAEKTDFVRRDKGELDAIKIELTTSVAGNLKDSQTVIAKDSSKKTGMLFPDSLGNESVYYSYDPNGKDTTDKRYFILYNNVKIFSDSLQGKCDSLYYTQLDSTIKMMKSPVVWSDKNQMIGDIIILHLDSNDLRKIEIPKNGILIAKSGPETAPFYDQIQGNIINGYLTNNKMDSLVAYQDAANIYYAKDEREAYIGVNESTSDRIEILFIEDEINTINYRGVTNGTTTPMTKINPENLKLTRFKWLINEKLPDLSAFLNGTTLSPPQLWNN